MTHFTPALHHRFDVLIVGSGLAGLSAALHLAPTHRVAVLTKRGMSDGSSAWAQGGIAAVLGEGDSFDAHVQDTLVAGAGQAPVVVTSSGLSSRPVPGSMNNVPSCRVAASAGAAAATTARATRGTARQRTARAEPRR